MDLFQNITGVVVVSIVGNVLVEGDFVNIKKSVDSIF